MRGNETRIRCAWRVLLLAQSPTRSPFLLESEMSHVASDNVCRICQFPTKYSFYNPLGMAILGSICFSFEIFFLNHLNLMVNSFSSLGCLDLIVCFRLICC